VLVFSHLNVEAGSFARFTIDIDNRTLTTRSRRLPAKVVWDFIAVLMSYRDYAAGEVEAAVELAIENNISTSDGVRHLLIYAGDVYETIAPLAFWSSLPPPSISVYGQLGGVQ
jgi:hypothetical protein